VLSKLCCSSSTRCIPFDKLAFILHCKDQVNGVPNHDFCSATYWNGFEVNVVNEVVPYGGDVPHIPHHILDKTERVQQDVAASYLRHCYLLLEACSQR
jgi:hypothetical protein